MNRTRSSAVCILFAACVALLAGASTLHAETVTAVWDRNTEPDVTGYKLSYGTQSGVYTTTLDVGNVTSTPLTLADGRRYYLAVRAYTASGAISGYSTEVVFDATGLNKITPANGGSVLTGGVTLSWSPITGATGYEVCLQPNSGGPCTAGWTPAGNATSFAFSLPAIGVTYYWQVRGLLAEGPMEADGGAWWVFGTSAPTFTPRPGNTVAGDFDRDGLADVGVFRPSNGQWYVRESHSGYSAAGDLIVPWGTSGDLPLLADFDGDGKPDLTVFRPSTGSWYVRSSATTFSTYQWGSSADTPMPADLDGDGKTDLVVYRPSSGMW